MTDDRIKLPYVDKKGLDGQRFYKYRQWIDRFKQYTKRKYEIDIGPLIKEENMPGTDEWNSKQEKIQQDFLWALGTEATQQITRSEYRTKSDNIKIDKLIKLYNRYYIPKKKQIQHNTYDRKNKKNTIPEALISHRGKDIKEEPIYKITYTGQYGTMSEERNKDRNCRYCHAPNSNPNHKCPARD